MNRCQRCVMPETSNHVILTDGVCDICRQTAQLEEKIAFKKTYDFQALLEKVNKIKKTQCGQPDCVVGVSGGKDSLMTLYIAKEQLGLSPLGVFIDNGFATEDLYNNATNAADALGIDLIIYKTDLFKRVFKYILQTKQPFYYCRLCHALIDKLVRDIALKYHINLVMGGYTKGQDYLKRPELFWVFKATDDFIGKELAKETEFNSITEMFPNLAKYFMTRYASVYSVSPFLYLKWDEDEVINLITARLQFKTPRVSWPQRSSNCLFNFVSQFLAVKHFGYSQHEVELSVLIRKNEISRARALEIINTPISRPEIQLVLDRVGLQYEKIV
ncbi:MAG: phosphoadenosine phosphosulfate reductase [Bacillota bacterium]